MSLTIPDILIDSLQRYKERTTLVIDWMLGKARPRLEPASKIRVAQLVPLAQQLAARPGPPLEVPSNILNALQKTIALRERCTTWYKSKTTTDTALRESNERHEYFTNVLKDVRTILEAHRASVSSVIGTSPGRGRLITATENIFESLGMESGLEELSIDQPRRREDAVSILPPEFVSTQAAPSASTQDMINTEDPYMAVFLMIEEGLLPLREHVMQKWKDYQAGTIHLSVVATVTKIAIALAHRIEEDVLSSQTGRNDWEDILTRVFCSATTLGEAPDASRGSSDSAKESVFQFPYQQLLQFRNAKGQISISQQLEPSSPHTSLNQLFVASLVLRLRDESLPSQDELMFGLNGVFTRDKISLGVVFGVQLFLDQHQTSGNHNLNCQPCLSQLTLS